MRKWSRFTKIMGKTVRPLSEKKKKKGEAKSHFHLGNQTCCLMNGINAH